MLEFSIRYKSELVHCCIMLHGWLQRHLMMVAWGVTEHLHCDTQGTGTIHHFYIYCIARNSWWETFLVWCVENFHIDQIFPHGLQCQRSGKFIGQCQELLYPTHFYTVQVFGFCPKISLSKITYCMVYNIIMHLVMAVQIIYFSKDVPRYS